MPAVHCFNVTLLCDVQVHTAPAPPACPAPLVSPVPDQAVSATATGGSTCSLEPPLVDPVSGPIPHTHSVPLAVEKKCTVGGSASEPSLGQHSKVKVRLPTVSGLLTWFEHLRLYTCLMISYGLLSNMSSLPLSYRWEASDPSMLHTVYNRNVHQYRYGERQTLLTVLVTSSTFVMSLGWCHMLQRTSGCWCQAVTTCLAHLPLTGDTLA